MAWFSDGRKNKTAARDVVFSGGSRKSVLLLPGYRCACVTEALSKGVINENTVCTFVERDLETFCRIRQWVSDEWRMPTPPMVYNRELHKLDLCPIDLGYIDLFGNLTEEDVKWIKNVLVQNLMPGCDLYFTFSTPVRNNEFIKRALHTVKNKYATKFLDKISKIKGIVGEAKQITALYEILFESMLKDFEYEIDYFTYRDRKPFTMLLFMVKNIRKTPEALMRSIYGEGYRQTNL